MGTSTPRSASRLGELRYGRGRLVIVHRHAHELRPGVGQAAEPVSRSTAASAVSVFVIDWTTTG